MSATSGVTAASSALQSLNADSFLKLYVTQLQNQDPTQPMDTSQMANSLAQLTQVQEMSQMNSSFSSLLSLEQFSAATNLIGGQVTYTPQDGSQNVAATVTSAEMQSGVAGVMAGGVFVPMNSIVAVSPASTQGK